MSEPKRIPTSLGEIGNEWVPVYYDEFSRQFADKLERCRELRTQIDEANRLFASMGKNPVIVTEEDLAEYVDLRTQDGRLTLPEP